MQKSIGGTNKCFAPAATSVKLLQLLGEFLFRKGHTDERRTNN